MLHNFARLLLLPTAFLALPSLARPQISACTAGCNALPGLPQEEFGGGSCALAIRVTVTVVAGQCDPTLDGCEIE
jgi:hypothetical protein